VSDAPGFLGEIEFAAGIPPGRDFGQFATLPNVQRIHALAHQFSHVLELMPYQKVGEPVKLLVSVYVESVLTKGRVIAVLIRDNYPADWRGLAQMVQAALEQVEVLVQLKGLYSETSIASAREALGQLNHLVSAQ